MKHRSLPPDFPFSQIPSSPPTPRRGKRAVLLAIAVASYASGWFHGSHKHLASETTSSDAPSKPSSAQTSGASIPGLNETELAFTPSISRIQQGPFPSSGLSFLPAHSWVHRLDSLSSNELLSILREWGSDQQGGMEAAIRSLALARLAQIDPHRALGFARTLPETERRAAQKAALSVWTEKDPLSASRYVAENLDGFGYLSADQRQAVATVARQWAMQDPKEAARWAATLPVEVQNEALLPTLAALASTHPSDAIHLANSMQDSLERSAVVQTLVRERARNAPLETSRWITQMPTAEDRAAAAQSLVQGWASQDSSSTEAWIQSLSDTTMRDAAVSALLETPGLRSQPEEAYRWIQTLQDPKIQASQLALLKARWSVLAPQTYALQFPAP